MTPASLKQSFKILTETLLHSLPQWDGRIGGVRTPNPQIPEQMMQCAADSLVYHCRTKKQNIINFSYGNPCLRNRNGEKGIPKEHIPLDVSCVCNKFEVAFLCFA